MRIYTLWHEGDGQDMPWIVDAVDEYTVDNNGEFPPEYSNKRSKPEHRELIIDVPNGAVRAIFNSLEIKATIVKE